MDGGEEGTRTLTMFPSPDFKSDASTDSATSPDMEVRAGVEPALTELQSVALPAWLKNHMTSYSFRAQLYYHSYFQCASTFFKFLLFY